MPCGQVLTDELQTDLVRQSVQVRTPHLNRDASARLPSSFEKTLQEFKSHGAPMGNMSQKVGVKEGKASRVQIHYSVALD